MKLFSFLLIAFLAAAPAFSQDSPEATTKMVKEMYDRLNKWDMTAFEEIVDPGFVEHTPMPDQKPGIEGIKDMFKAFQTAFPDMHQDIIDMISSDGKKVSVLVKMTGTHQGDFMGMKPTGNKFDVLAADIMYVNSGKVTEHWGFIDLDKFMRQLGMMK